ncbi:GP46-like surface antigen, putative [Bodo saltans]|uniref:GP46-like surface antigen, putative n=1 Tax=Bodo saltans TaxID=75058 RepID=A0A0S4JF41_BODSA|nr:GP46-like surface antigen, putative [Bodo saltans]|eukprot:CUG88595.1 GP46-like surface antigen, putative [Bodo saltans]
MRIATNILFGVLLLLLLVAPLNLPQSVQALCNCTTPASTVALQALYDSTGGVMWSDPWDMTSDDNLPCLGVTCDEGVVVSIDLSNRGLAGTLPSNLSSLSNISKFNVSSNNIHGTLPRELASWSLMEMFDVSSNHLSGTLPAEYGLHWNHSASKQMYFHNNSITGTHVTA